MPIEKKSFFLGMDGDTSQRLLDDKACLNIMNGRVAVTQYGRNLRVENIPGTFQTTQTVYPSYTHQTVGSCIDINRNNLIWANWNSGGLHGIYMFDYSTFTTYAVLYDSQVIGGLNFSKTSRIDRNMKVVGDLLMWTDDNEEPKCINYIAAIKTNDISFVTDVSPYTFPMKYETSTLIKRPPVFPLQVTKVIDVSFENNLVRNRAYQFTYRYHFRDKQISAIASYSELIPYGFVTDVALNAIQVVVSFSEYIDDDIEQIDICVKYGNFGDTLIIKQYNKNNSVDAADIINHNAGSVGLNFNFYDNIAGTPLGGTDANVPFHNVPLLAKTMESARNRVFLANFVAGYDTPTTSSLNVTLVETDTGASSSFAGLWGFITLHANLTSPGQDEFMFPFVQRTSDSTFYYFPSVRNSTIWNGGLGTVPASISVSLASVSASNEADLVSNLKSVYYPTGSSVGSPPWLVPYDITFNAFGGSSAVTVSEFVPDALNQFFKSNSTYLVNIAFYDRFRRKCGVLKDPIQVSIPIRTYAQTVFTTLLQWTLSNGNAANEIPDWAYYYQIHITKNQTTRFFVQSRAFNSTYVVKEQDGTYTYGNATASTDTYAIGFDLTTLNSYGLGYTFTEGDRANIFTASDSETLSVLGQDGNYVLISPISIGTLDATSDVLLELYTPYVPSLTESYYETGPVFAISSPGTAERSYSTLVGQINGDAYAIERTDKDSDLYIVEAMSPNDNVWQFWQTDTGWSNIITQIGQVDKENSIPWSDTYILGSGVNGINIFQPLNQRNIDSELGSITKLQLASKSKEEGTIMLCICTRQIASLYLQEVQLKAAASTADVVTTDNVIGTVNVLKGLLGCQNPETVIERLGLVFGLDVNEGTFWQYSEAGLSEVSRFKQQRFFQNYCAEYLQANANNLDNINGFHHIPTCVDPAHKEVLVTLPGLIYENYADVLPSYGGIVPIYATSIINRFDIFDRLAKTMGFQYEENKWGDNYEFMGEWYDYLQNTMFGFKGGYLYIHNYDNVNWNRFYGVQYPVRICLTANFNPSALKVLNNIALESNAIPDYTVAMTTFPNQQITDLTADDYTDQEGLYYADFFKDRLSPSAVGTPDEKLYTGDDLTDIVLQVMAEFQQYDSLFYCNFIDIGYSISRGQKQILNPVNT